MSVTVKHLRKMVELAYLDVERLREEKAKAENVPYVPGRKPVDIVELHDAMYHLDEQRAQKSWLEHWFKAAENTIEHSDFERILKALEPFGVKFHVHAHTSNPDAAVTITKESRRFIREERESYGG